MNFQKLDQKSLSFNINGLQIEAKTWGNKTGIPVLALHGWLDNASTFDEIAPYLEGCYIVAPDFAGHGLSEHRPLGCGYYLWEHAMDMNELVRQLGWSHFSVLAHSMGTGVTSILSAINNKVQSSIFLDGMGAPFVIGLEKTVNHFKQSYRMAEMAKKSGMYGHAMQKFTSMEEAIKARMNGVGGQISFAAAKTLAMRDIKDSNGKFVWRHDPRLVYPEPIQLTNQQAFSFLQQMNHPVHFMLGKEGLFVDTEQERYNFLPETHEISWFEGGHHFHLENPSTEFIRLISSKIRAVQCAFACATVSFDNSEIR